MRLFDPSKVDPCKVGPRTNGETIFDYVESASAPKVERVRNFIELWFEEYPEADKQIFRKHIRWDDQFENRLFELTVYSTFKILGATVQVEVANEAHKSRPDFLVTLNNGFEFYVECVRVSSDKPLEFASKEKLPETRIRNVLREKARKDYPRDRPLLIAMAAHSHDWSKDSALAVFGIEFDSERTASSLGTSEFTLGGFWADYSLESRANVFSILAFTDFGLGGLSRSKAVSYERPFNEFPAAFRELGFASCRYEDQRTILLDGPSLGELHGLPADWPAGRVLSEITMDAIEFIQATNPLRALGGPREQFE